MGRVGVGLIVLLAAAAARATHTPHAPRAWAAARPPVLAASPPPARPSPRSGADLSSRRIARRAPLRRGRALLAIRDEASPSVPSGSVEDSGTYRAALVQTGLIAFAALTFGVGVWFWRGEELAFQFFAGYVIEESLSVDNLFVFKLIFDFFAVTGAAQKKCLNWGIWAAALFRLIMISLGVEAVSLFEPILLVFAAILIASSGSILAESFAEEKEPPDLAENVVVKFCSSILPTTDEMDGDKFWTVAADGVTKATPLLVALACIEVSDVVFAIDSVPAVLGVTSDTFVAFTSNIFAILGLRALFRVLSTLVADFAYLQARAAAAGGPAAAPRPRTRRARLVPRSRAPCCHPCRADPAAPLGSRSAVRVRSRRSRLCSASWGARWSPSTSATRSRSWPRSG